MELFAWSNQVMAAFTLLAGTIYLTALKKPSFVTVLPGVFITFVVSVYILWISPEHGGPVGFGLELYDAFIIAGFLSFLLFAWALRRGNELSGKADF